MDARTLEKRRRELYNTIPLFGRSIRRRAVAALAADGSAEAVRELAQAAVQNRDATIRDLALESVSQVTQQPAINAVCDVWHETRHPTLDALLHAKQWVATAPPEVRVSSALHIGALDLLIHDAAGLMGLLLGACGDFEPQIAANARAALRSLTEQPAREALCDFVINEEHPVAREIALEMGYLPEEAPRRALFLFLTEQWERYDALDFDQRLLRAAYEAAAEGIRRRVREKLRLTGRADFLTIVVGHDYRARAAAMTPEELEFVLRMLQGQQAWDRVWALALEILPLWSARALGILRRAGWQPRDAADRAVFAQCAALAAEELALDEAVMPQHFPCALFQAQLRAPGRINDVAFSPTDSRLAVATGVRKLALWNYETAQTERVLSGFEHSVGQVIFTRSGQLVCAERTNVTTSATGVYGWGGDGLFKLGEHQGSIMALAALAGDLALSAGRDAAVVVWDVAARAERARRVMGEWPRAMCVSQRGDAALVLLQREFYRLTAPALDPGAWGRLDSTPRSAAFLPGNDAALIGRNNGQVRLYEIRRNQQWEQWIARADFMTEHVQAAVGIEVLPERNYILTAGHEGEVRFFDLASRASLGQAVIPSGEVTALHVSPDGAFMAVGSADASFSLWDLRMPDVAALLRTPLAHITPSAVGVLDACAHNPKLSVEARRAVQFVAALARHRTRFDIELETGVTHTIMAGEFDIEIE